MIHRLRLRVPIDVAAADVTVADVAFAAVVLAAGLACTGPASSAPARAPSAPPGPARGAEPPAEAAGAAERDAAEEPSRADETANDVVTLIAKPGLWPLDVEAAWRVLQAFGPVNREQRSPSALSLVGGPYGALDRFDVTYSLDDERYWVFGSAGFFLDGRDPAQLYRALEARLTQLLGRPARTEPDADAGLPPVVWNLGEAWLSLAPSTDHGEEVVLIAIRENEGYSH